MNTLPTKPTPPQPPRADVAPTWRELGERFQELMRDIGVELGYVLKKEGKDLEREFEVRLLPRLRRARKELDRVIERLEDHTKK
jgi:hypothetical protein